jgi:hypothetical protein
MPVIPATVTFTNLMLQKSAAAPKVHLNVSACSRRLGLRGQENLEATVKLVKVVNELRTAVDDNTSPPGMLHNAGRALLCNRCRGSRRNHLLKKVVGVPHTTPAALNHSDRNIVESTGWNYFRRVAKTWAKVYEGERRIERESIWSDENS